MEQFAGVGGAGGIEQLILKIEPKPHRARQGGENLEVPVAFFRGRTQQDHAVDRLAVRGVKIEAPPGEGHHPRHGEASGQNAVGDRKASAQAGGGLLLPVQDAGEEILPVYGLKPVAGDQEVGEFADGLLLGLGPELGHDIFLLEEIHEPQAILAHFSHPPKRHAGQDRPQNFVNGDHREHHGAEQSGQVRVGGIVLDHDHQPHRHTGLGDQRRSKVAPDAFGGPGQAHGGVRREPLARRSGEKICEGHEAGLLEMNGIQVQAGQGEKDRENRRLEIRKDRIHQMAAHPGDVGLDNPQHEAGQKGRNPQAGGEAGGKDQGEHGPGGHPLGAYREPGELIHGQGHPGADARRQEQLAQGASGRFPDTGQARAAKGGSGAARHFEEHDTGHVVQGHRGHQGLDEDALGAGFLDHRQDGGGGRGNRDGGEQQGELGGTARQKIERRKNR